jgi:serine/threonine-protein kinase
VKVLDFGLVKTAGAADLDPGLTAPNTVTGTPAYISPESAIGEAVDHRSDIYSLGCVAYWMLTGRSVFTAEQPMQIIARHLQTTPAPPSQYSAFPIPAMLEETVLACLMKRPEDRPASARDLCDRLSQCSVEPWTREDAERWWEQRMEPERRVMLEV